MCEYHIAFNQEVHFKWEEIVGIQEKDIIKTLDTILDPQRDQGLYESGLISGLQITDNDIVFMIQIDPSQGSAMEPIRQQAEAAISALSKTHKVSAILTAEKAADKMPDPHGMNKNPRLDLPIKHIIAVASGKGGVGKSTIAFNLAHALAKSGLKTGLMDADIYGPSVPTLAGLPYEKPDFDEKRNIIPFEKHGLKIMSIGFMVDPDKALVWRGPMVQSAIYQMLRDVVWASDDDPLDVLIIDMPPGTGDAQLTLAQKVPVSSAIIVSTPQDLALIDARKGIEMFTQVDVPILGLVENMSVFCCPKCGHEEPIFGANGIKAEAKKLDIPLLAQIPLTLSLRENADAGTPSDLPVFGEMAKALSGL